jgi:hypothetical protein
MTYYLNRLEWEILQDDRVIETASEPSFLTDTCEKITLSRDEDYGLTAQVNGRHGVAITPPDHEGPPGSTLVPFRILGTDRYGKERYTVEQCYVTKVNQRGISNAEEKYATQSTVHIRCRRVKIEFNRKEEIEWTTEWYLNAPDVHDYACRSTKRKYTIDHVRTRYGDDENFGNYRDVVEESNSVDHLVINCGERKCIVHAVTEEIGPTWTKRLGIEYRKEFGWFPEKSDRDAVAEIVGYVFGKHLLNIGSTNYNLMGYPICAYAFSPWVKARSQSQTSQWPPLRLRPYGTANNVEEQLNRLLPPYLALRDQFGLQEALWRYWIANELPVGASVPLLANGIEIMANAWFANNKSASKGVYMEKGEWDKILACCVQDIKRSLGVIEYADRILSRIRNSFQMGANDRLEVFFKEIGLKLGQPELDAIKARNKMIHASIGVSGEEIKSAIRHTHAYRTLFHRVFLRLLGFDGKYVDYSSIGWVERQIDEPTDTDKSV